MRRLDSHQIVGLLIMGGVLTGLVALAFQRIDWAIMAGFAAVLGYYMLGPKGKDDGGGGGGGGLYQDGDGDCGGGD